MNNYFRNILETDEFIKKSVISQKVKSFQELMEYSQSEENDIGKHLKLFYQKQQEIAKFYGFKDRNISFDQFVKVIYFSGFSLTQQIRSFKGPKASNFLTKELKKLEADGTLASI